MTTSLASSHGRFAGHVIAGHDRTKFHVTIYLNRALSSWAMEEALQSGSADRVVIILGKDTREVVELVRRDEIDILVDLAGHSRNHRLDVFASSAAPVQATWIGYPNTTGLRCVQYRITDEIVDPPSSTQKFAETLYRLPQTFLCYPVASIVREPETPTVAPPPFEAKGFVTFGSFNRVVKLHEACVATWARLLLAVEGSRLVLKSSSSFARCEVREEWLGKFEALGVPPERIMLLPPQTDAKLHLSSYAEVDIALDAFPYGGTTTTVEAVMMGCPVVVMQAPADVAFHAWNVGRGLLTSMGLQV